ncbi:hypothetical protein ABK040_014779 [Willaertia magna]
MQQKILNRIFPDKTIKTIQHINKGYEHAISIITFTNDINNNNDDKVIFRKCKFHNDTNEFHFPIIQFLSNLLLQNKINVISKIIYFEENFCLESYLPGSDISDLPNQWDTFNEKQLNYLLKQLSNILLKLHKINCKKFGDINKKETILNNNSIVIGKDNNWLDTFDNSFQENLNYLKKKKKFKKEKELLKVFEIVKNKIENFNEPKLVHADLNANNIRVQFNEKNQNYELTGLLDFGDVKAGDPRFDFGRLLSHWKGDWNKLNILCKYYYYGNNVGMTKEDEIMIQFYAIYYCVFLYTVFDGKENDEKYFNILTILLQKWNELNI